jgi:hypothetical protein
LITLEHQFGKIPKYQEKDEQDEQDVGVDQGKDQDIAVDRKGDLDFEEQALEPDKKWNQPKADKNDPPNHLFFALPLLGR